MGNGVVLASLGATREGLHGKQASQISPAPVPPPQPPRCWLGQVLARQAASSGCARGVGMALTLSCLTLAPVLALVFMAQDAAAAEVPCDIATSGQSAMMACCPAIGGGHRRLQGMSCDLPPACPSSRCAEGFATFMSTCGEAMSTEWGADEPLFVQFEAFFGDCQQRFGATLKPQRIQPDDPNLQLIGRFRLPGSLQSPTPAPAAPLDPNLPRYAVLAGCLPSHGYYVITDITDCEAAKAVLEPRLVGVQDGGFVSSQAILQLACDS